MQMWTNVKKKAVFQMMKNAFFFVYVLFFLFMTQRLNRAEFCRLFCGINTKEDTDQENLSEMDFLNSAASRNLENFVYS